MSKTCSHLARNFDSFVVENVQLLSIGAVSIVPSLSSVFLCVFVCFLRGRNEMGLAMFCIFADPGICLERIFLKMDWFSPVTITCFWGHVSNKGEER